MSTAAAQRTGAPTLRTRWQRVMGGNASAVLVGPAGASTADLLRWSQLAESRLRALEAQWSRFRGDSAISALARAGGRAVAVPPETRTLIRAMADAWAITDGYVDAAVTPDVVAAGYSASVTDPAQVTWLPTAAKSRADWTDVRIDDEAGTVALPPGIAADPGGIGKGLAADLVVAELLAAGAAGALVEVGGDLRAAGAGPHGDGWRIAIAAPEGIDVPLVDDRAVATVRVGDGAVATSSTRRRRFLLPDGTETHHLIGADGRPAEHGLATCTVVMGSGALAEALAKVPLLLGATAGLQLLARYETPALLIDDEGTVTTTNEWEQVAA